MFAKEQKQFLFFLLTTTPNQVKLLLKHLTRDQYTAIREVAVNLLRGTFGLSSAQIKILRKHRQFYRQLARSQKIKLLQKPVILLLEAARPTLEQL